MHTPRRLVLLYSFLLNACSPQTTNVADVVASLNNDTLIFSAPVSYSFAVGALTPMTRYWFDSNYNIVSTKPIDYISTFLTDAKGHALPQIQRGRFFWYETTSDRETPGNAPVLDANGRPKLYELTPAAPSDAGVVTVSALARWFNPPDGYAEISAKHGGRLASLIATQTIGTSVDFDVVGTSLRIETSETVTVDVWVRGFVM